MDLAAQAIKAAAVMAKDLVLGIADVGDQAAKDAKKLGLTAEAVQELNHAANLAGTDFSTMKVGLQALTRGLNDAATKGTGPAAEALEQLGISLDDPAVKSKDLEQVLALLSDRFAKMPDDADKTALSMKLFSRSGAELIPLLNEGSAGIASMRQEARDLGNVMSNESAASAEEFNDNMTRLKAQLSGVGVSVVSELLPAFDQMIQDTQDWVAENDEFIRQELPDMIREGVRAAKEFLPVLVYLAKEVKDAVTWVNEIVDAFQFWIEVSEDVGFGLESLTNPLGAVWGLIKDITNGILDLAAAIPGLESVVNDFRNSLGLDKDATVKVKISEKTEQEIRKTEKEFRKIAKEGGPAVIGGLSRSGFRDLGPKRGEFEVIKDKIKLGRRLTKNEREIAKAGGLSVGGGGGGKKKKDEPTIEELIKQAGGGASGGTKAAALSGAQFVRIDQSYNAPTEVTIQIDGSRDPAAIVADLEVQIGRVIDQLNRQAFDHYHQPVKTG